MPYNPAQVRLFQAVKHGGIKRKGLSKGKAAEILAEAGQSRKSGQAAKILTKRK
jgi:hypothetical protein